jgi:hypothetical protein
VHLNLNWTSSLYHFNEIHFSFEKSGEKTILIFLFVKNLLLLKLSLAAFLSHLSCHSILNSTLQNSIVLCGHNTRFVEHIFS